MNLYYFWNLDSFCQEGFSINYYLLKYLRYDKVGCIFRMATAFQQAICSNQLHRYSDSSSLCEESRNFTMITKIYRFGTSKMPLKKANCRYNGSKVFVVRASVSDSILSSLDTSSHISWKMTGKFNLEFVFICEWYLKAKRSDQNFNI